MTFLIYKISIGEEKKIQKKKTPDRFEKKKRPKNNTAQLNKQTSKQASGQAKLTLETTASSSPTEHHNISKVTTPPTPIKKTCPDPVSTITTTQLADLDPTGTRTRLFDRQNPECARPGDILLVRLRTGDPFAGVCINIRRRGLDTAVLLRGQLTRVGVEMWYKVYSPAVEGIEVVQRAAKRARRARLTYMRKPKHDRGSVENVVRMYLRQKAALGAVSEDGKTPDARAKAKAMAMAGGGKKKKKAGKGKKR